MSRIIPEQLSTEYRIVRAEEWDFDALYTLYRSNRDYFDYFSLAPTRERLKDDMTMLPKGCRKDQKLFLAYLSADTPAAILDLIDGYPNGETCYIGLFMVDKALHRRCVGTKIITDLCEKLEQLGYAAVRLTYGKHYAAPKNFWTKNGFLPLCEAIHEEYGELIVAERKLSQNSKNTDGYQEDYIC